ncbi:hypothetical protein GA0070607_4273 [Micromonospora coriariae]|uniref:Uncharacterized protein n=1 Tax=Micromonospora coriariae TaxID=285665 RepID=A0A1C4WWB8_9ACTN|nr:hypothetical protein GA0070607_4273 [Micromonospora coriariae]
MTRILGKDRAELTHSVPAQRHAYSLLRPDRLPPLPACP